MMIARLRGKLPSKPPDDAVETRERVAKRLNLL